MKQERINIDDEIFRFVYIESMRDAVIWSAYKGKKKELEESCVRESLKRKVEPLIDNVLNDAYSSSEKYDKDFLDTTIHICECIKDETGNDEFTFGNAQKFINIMLKYFYISNYKNKELRKGFRFCHCPMDRQLLEKIWSVWEQNPPCNNVITGRKKGDFVKSWGNEDFEIDENRKKKLPERYMLFQEAVRCLADKNGIIPLEYDYCEWGEENILI